MLSRIAIVVLLATSCLASFIKIPLTCIDGTTPPCITPTGLNPELLTPDVSGEFKYNNDPSDGSYGSTNIKIKIHGLNRDLHIITAWMIHYFPVPPTCLGCNIFNGTASISSPLAHTKAAYTSGMDPAGEPNYLDINEHGVGKLKVDLDYDIFSNNTVPLVNAIHPTNQVGALPPANQPGHCCPNAFPSGLGPPLSVGTQLLRQWNQTTGLQLFELDGITPKLVRSPVHPVFIAVAVHIYGMTQGINIGNDILPLNGTNVTQGDHYLLGMFDLSNPL